MHEPGMSTLWSYDSHTHGVWHGKGAGERQDVERRARARPRKPPGCAAFDWQRAMAQGLPKGQSSQHGKPMAALRGRVEVDHEGELQRGCGPPMLSSS